MEGVRDDTTGRWHVKMPDEVPDTPGDAAAVTGATRTSPPLALAVAEGVTMTAWDPVANRPRRGQWRRLTRERPWA